MHDSACWLFGLRDVAYGTFPGPGGLTLERGKINGSGLRRSEEKPGAPKVGGGHGVIGGPLRAFRSAMNQSGHSMVPPPLSCLLTEMLFIRRIIAAFGWLSQPSFPDNWKKSFQDGLLFAYYHYSLYNIVIHCYPPPFRGRVRPVSRKSEYRRHDNSLRLRWGLLSQGSSKIFVRLYVTARPVLLCWGRKVQRVQRVEKMRKRRKRKEWRTAPRSTEYVKMKFECPLGVSA